MVIRSLNKEKAYITPSVRWARSCKLADVESYTTGQLFTVTNAGTATVTPALYPTPGTVALPGRSALGVTYNSATTDGLNLTIPVASVIPQYNEPIVLKGAFAATTIATAEFLMELAVVGTGLIATPATNYIGIRKKTGDTHFYLVSRKASGTEESVEIPMGTLTDGYWYDFVLQITRDNSTLGQGVAEVWWDVNAKAETALTNYWKLPVATQFPDTVAMAPSIATRVGASGVTCYFDYFVFQIGV
jgi:hypothetical protein